MGNSPCSKCNNWYRSAEIRIASNLSNNLSSEIQNNQINNTLKENSSIENSIAFQKNTNVCLEKEEFKEYFPKSEIQKDYTINVFYK